MKKLYKRLAAALCAGMMMFSAGAFAVSAEEENTGELLPSGLSISEIDALRPGGSTSGIISIGSSAFGVFRGDEVLLEKYTGTTDMRYGTPADENSVYEWGSISKTLIWVSVMQLWEQGKIDLDRDVREYLPDGFFRRLSYDEPITMMNLMNHNAGWQETTRPLFTQDENNIPPLGRALQEIEPAQVNRPGEITAYSNYGAAVAGYVVECITGTDFCEYVHKNIFEPLGMEHTALAPTHSDNPWVQEQRQKMRSSGISLNREVDLGSKLYYLPAYPAGAAAGTLKDLMTYAQALVNDDAPLFRDPEAQEFMFTGTDFYGSSDIPMCCHGFWCEEYGVRVCGHSGATLAGQANMIFDPDSKTGLVIMVNCPGGNWFLDNLPSYVFGELSPDKYAAGEVTSAEGELAGYYLNARSEYRGMFRFIPYITGISSKNFSDLENIGNDILMLKTESGRFDGEEAAIIGAGKYSSGKSGILRQPSVDLIADNFYTVKLVLFTAYIVAAVASVYMLLIRLKLKKHHRLTAYAGSGAAAAGQAAKIISLTAFLAAFLLYYKNSGGITFAQGAVTGIIQMICTVVCAVSAAAALISMISGKKRGKNYIYILSIIGNTVCISAVIYYEMYRFWGC